MDLDKLKVWIASLGGGAVISGLAFALDFLDEFKAAIAIVSGVITAVLAFINWKKDE
jgi:hypothetical protein